MSKCCFPHRQCQTDTRELHNRQNLKQTKHLYIGVYVFLCANIYIYIYINMYVCNVNNSKTLLCQGMTCSVVTKYSWLHLPNGRVSCSFMHPKVE